MELENEAYPGVTEGGYGFPVHTEDVFPFDLKASGIGRGQGTQDLEEGDS